MEREDPFHPDPKGNFPNREGRSEAASSLGNDDSLENLDPFLVAFFDDDMDLDRIPDIERLEVGLPFLLLGQINEAHCLFLS
jgi:hypothetical protein